jgi:predicted nucleic-acid-binding Zn-ribbon protein
MPDSEGRLSDDEKKTVKSWIEGKWTQESADCPICGRNDWNIGEHVAEMPALGKTMVAAKRATYPHVALVCLNCGHTLLFNAVVIGIVPRQSQKQSDAEEESGG